MNKYLTLFLVVFLFVNCKPRVNNIAEFKSWFNDPENEFVKEKYVNDLKFSVQYRPAELMICNELKDLKKGQSSLDSLKRTYKNSLYFLLEIGFDEREKKKQGDVLLKDIHTYEQYVEKVNYLSFQLENNTWLVVGKDTIPPSLYHFERGYELGKKQTIMFAFPYSGSINKKDMAFFFNDDAFKTGLNIFKFNIDSTKQPELPYTTK